MLIRILAAIAAVFITGSSNLVLAETLIVEPTSPNLTPTTFEYRYDATRGWLGCYSYDVLQGTGWYPSVWRHEQDFTPYDGDFEVTWNRTFAERYCNATIGEYNNYVRVVWTNPNDPSETYSGVVLVENAGESTTDEVTCRLRDASDSYNALECDRSVISLTSGEPAYLVVHVEGLE